MKLKYRFRQKVFIILVIFLMINLCAVSAWAEESTQAASLAEAAYYELEDHVFSLEHRKQANEKIQMAYNLDPNEPFVYVSRSRLELVNGYQSGDWYDPTVYLSGTLEACVKHAQKALELDPNFLMAHAHLARLYITQKEYNKAKQHLDRAKEIDPANFYTWYFKGVLALQKEELTNAYRFFEEAEKYITRPMQQAFINQNLQYIAQLEGDVQKEEKVYLKMIEQNPESPHMRGNYAYFLAQHGRFDESVYYYEKAIELGPYGIAIQQLELVKEMRDKERKAKKQKFSVTG